MDLYLTLGVCVGVNAIQPRHCVAVEYLEVDATKYNGCRTYKDLLQQVLPGLWS